VRVAASTARANPTSRVQAHEGLNLVGELSPLIATLAACFLRAELPDSRIVRRRPPVYKEAGDWQQAGGRSNDQARELVRMLFPGPASRCLGGKVRSANQNLKAAFARLQEARPQRASTRAGLFPHSVLGAPQRARHSVSRPDFAREQEPTLNNFDLQADHRTKVDLWGRVRKTTVSAAKATGKSERRRPPRAWICAAMPKLATRLLHLESQDAAEQVFARERPSRTFEVSCS